MEDLRTRMGEAGIDVALITDDDTVYYLTGYYDYLHMEFGRPTILVVPRDGKSLLITPTIDAVMAHGAARVDRIAAWNDGAGNEWREELPGRVMGRRQSPSSRTTCRPWCGPMSMTWWARRGWPTSRRSRGMRMIKSAEELQLARHAGEVAGAMMAAGRAAIGDGVAEFEVAIATSQAGTRKAAELARGAL